MDEEYVGGDIYKNIKIDDRVNPELKHCLYCSVECIERNGSIRTTSYKIPLEAVGKEYLWKCPSCEKIYILKDQL